MEKETREMFEILRKNKEKVKLENLAIKEEKSRKKRTIITGLILVLVLILLLVLAGKMNNDFISNCTKGGLSENVCRLSM